MGSSEKTKSRDEKVSGVGKNLLCQNGDPNQKVLAKHWVCAYGDIEALFSVARWYVTAYFLFRYAAKDKRTLQAHRITHVLNAADGKFNVNTGQSFYRDTNITYHGVEAFDMPSFDLSPFFYQAANFIKNALSSPTGEKLSVHSSHLSSF